MFPAAQHSGEGVPSGNSHHAAFMPRTPLYARAHASPFPWHWAQRQHLENPHPLSDSPSHGRPGQDALEQQH